MFPCGDALIPSKPAWQYAAIEPPARDATLHETDCGPTLLRTRLRLALSEMLRRKEKEKQISCVFHYTRKSFFDKRIINTFRIHFHNARHRRSNQRPRFPLKFRP